jgi:FkbH-like protein
MPPPKNELGEPSNSLHPAHQNNRLNSDFAHSSAPRPGIASPLPTNAKLKPVAEPFRVSVSASFTAEPLAPALHFWGAQLGIDFDVRFAPFQQVIPTLLNPTGDFAANRHGVNVALVRAADLGARSLDNAAQLVSALRTASARDAASLIFVLCPGPPSEAEQHLRAELSTLPATHFLDYLRIDALYPVATRFDAAADRLGAIPYTEPYFAAMATALARQIAALSLPPYKVIALDCDNTLWQGICGEDGPSGVTLPAGHRALQDFILQQRDAGMLLCLASKNNRDDVLETFAQHPEMPLRLDHLTAMRVDWETKPANLAALAAELNLGLDSLIFLDDSPKECAEMEEARPEVLSLPLPADPARIPHFLQHVWAFDHPVVTEEDRKRAASYVQTQEFGRAFQSAHSLEEFMATLDLTVRIETATPAQIPRVAQLTQRTSQFNFTTVRRTEAEIAALLDTHLCLTVHVSDRFGDYGLTGVVILSPDFVVDTFLLSCRVLGRGVEHQVMSHLGWLANNRGLATIRTPIRPTSKNKPAQQFLESIGGQVHTAAALLNLRWQPAAQPPVQTGAPATPSAPAQHRFIPFAKIAREFSTIDDILTAMRGSGPELDASLTPTERDLAAIWADLLKVPTVHRTDRFFDIGGHSLLAVLLISRIRDRFQIELPIDDVYSGDLTLRDLAARIDALQSGAAPADDYEAMLAEIESLSDEEVRALLEQR